MVMPEKKFNYIIKTFKPSESNPRLSLSLLRYGYTLGFGRVKDGNGRIYACFLFYILLKVAISDVTRQVIILSRLTN